MASVMADGLEYHVVTMLDAMANISGGIKRQGTALGNIKLNIKGDTEKLGWYPDGNFFLQLLGHYGGKPSELVGDLQGVSNIQAPNVIKLYQAWYKQRFPDNGISVLAGLYDYNSEFYSLDTAGLFINSSFGIGPAVSQVSPSIYPDTVMSVRLKYQITPTAYAMAILSNGHLLSDPERPRHETTRLRDGPFLGMEVGITHPPESAPAETKLALGLWKNAADFKDFNAIQRKSVNGAYLIGEKPLYKRNDATRGLAGFFQVGVAQGDRTRIAHYLGTGLTYQGPFASRADDIVGLGVARASNGTEFLAANPGLLRAETTLELTYKAKFAGDLTLRPDLQYVINPGTDPALDNALLVYFRLQKTF